MPSTILKIKAGGNGSIPPAEALLKTGKHCVTALTRNDSQSRLPEVGTVERVEHDRLETLVGALRGRNAPIITLILLWRKPV